MVNRSGSTNRFITGAVLFVFCSTLFTGCSTFRRKFIRHDKNKEAKEDFLPVLEPVEYKREELSPLDVYKSHYGMVKAYFGDVYAALGNVNSGEKRERYLISQIMAHVQGMAALLNGTRKDTAQAAADSLQEATKELDKPAGLRRYDILKGTVHKVETDIRRSLKPDMVKEFLVAP
ncbi:MAG: hypothetical protein HQL22_00965 [Candidatus Omnitrophica bacterium]|nr:hypothetical protein [Candidatus Omnitrophota bacterium]